MVLPIFVTILVSVQSFFTTETRIFTTRFYNLGKGLFGDEIVLDGNNFSDHGISRHYTLTNLTKLHGLFTAETYYLIEEVIGHIISVNTVENISYSDPVTGFRFIQSQSGYRNRCEPVVFEHGLDLHLFGLSGRRISDHLAYFGLLILTGDKLFKPVQFIVITVIFARPRTLFRVESHAMVFQCLTGLIVGLVSKTHCKDTHILALDVDCADFTCTDLALGNSD